MPNYQEKIMVRLSLNQLEAREVPAGNVTAVVTNGTLEIRVADYMGVQRNAESTIWVDVYDDRIVVMGRDSTTINGVPPEGGVSSVPFYGDENSISAIKFEGNSGHDTFEVFTWQKLTAERNMGMTIETFGGSDYVYLHGGSISGPNLSGSVNINTGSGGDAVVIGNYSNVTLGVDLGDGNDRFTVLDPKGVAAVSYLNGGKGSDTIKVFADFYSSFGSIATNFEKVELMPQWW